MRQYLIGDALIRIKNAQARRFKSVVLPASKVIKSILDILKQECRIFDYKIYDVDTQKVINKLSEAKKAEIHVRLRYFVDKRHVVDSIPLIREVKLYSKPSCRIYKTREALKKLVHHTDLKLYIVSTSAGMCKVVDDSFISNPKNSVSTAHQLGGELICCIA